MMDVITGRAPPQARAGSHRSKGSRELARPGPSLLETLRSGWDGATEFIRVPVFIFQLQFRSIYFPLFFAPAKRFEA